MLRRNNEDLLQRIKLRNEDIAALEVKNTALENQVAVLHDLAKGTSAAEKLRVDLLAFFEKHEDMAHERYMLLIESQDKVAKAIGHFTAAVEDRNRRRQT